MAENNNENDLGNTGVNANSTKPQPLIQKPAANVTTPLSHLNFTPTQPTFAFGGSGGQISFAGVSGKAALPQQPPPAAPKASTMYNPIPDMYKLITANTDRINGLETKISQLSQAQISTNQNDPKPNTHMDRILNKMSLTVLFETLVTEFSGITNEIYKMIRAARTDETTYTFLRRENSILKHLNGSTKKLIEIEKFLDERKVELAEEENKSIEEAEKNIKLSQSLNEAQQTLGKVNKEKGVLKQRIAYVKNQNKQLRVEKKLLETEIFELNAKINTDKERTNASGTIKLDLEFTNHGIKLSKKPYQTEDETSGTIVVETKGEAEDEVESSDESEE